MSPFEPVGLAEIAEKLGVDAKTARQWKFRQLLPEPDAHVSGRDVWEWRTIEKWARKTGRLSADG